MAGRKSLLRPTRKKPAKSGTGHAGQESKRKKAILDAVKRSSASVKATLQGLGLPQSTYYRWLRLYKAKGLDGLEAGSPVSDEVWQQFADLEKKEGRLLDKRKVSTKETQPMKSEQDKKGIKKPLDEKASKEPDKTVAPETGDRPEAGEPKTVKEPPSPPSYTPPPREPVNYTFLKYVISGVGAFVCVVAIIVLASASNSSKFYFKQDGRMIELWQGRFDPMGEHLVASFSDPKILEGIPEQDTYTQEQAFGIIYDYCVNRADKLLYEGETPEFRAVKSYLNDARNYTQSWSESQAIRMRLNSVEFLSLLRNTDLALTKTPLPDFQAAWGYLAKAVPVASTDLQRDILMKKLEAVEYALTSRGIGKGEGELAKLSAGYVSRNLKKAKGYAPEKPQEIDQEEMAKLNKWLNEFDKKYVEAAL
jgi:transposase-like protein